MFSSFSSFASSIQSAAEAVATNVVPVLNELSGNVQSLIATEQKEFQDQDAKVEELKKKEQFTPAVYPLWAVWAEDRQILEAECKNRILKLSSDLKIFQNTSSQKSKQSKFDLRLYESLCESALNNDQLLATRRYRLVPRKMSESEFWENYLSHVDEIRRELELPTLLEHPAKILELEARGLLPNNNGSIELNTKNSNSNNSNNNQTNSNQANKDNDLEDDMNALLSESFDDNQNNKNNNNAKTNENNKVNNNSSNNNNNKVDSSLSSNNPIPSSVIVTPVISNDSTPSNSSSITTDSKPILSNNSNKNSNANSSNNQSNNKKIEGDDLDLDSMLSELDTSGPAATNEDDIDALLNE